VNPPPPLPSRVSLLATTCHIQPHPMLKLVSTTIINPEVSTPEESTLLDPVSKASNHSAPALDNHHQERLPSQPSKHTILATPRRKAIRKEGPRTRVTIVGKQKLAAVEGSHVRDAEMPRQNVSMATANATRRRSMTIIQVAG
jgi:hypothetical protein